MLHWLCWNIFSRPLGFISSQFVATCSMSDENGRTNRTNCTELNCVSSVLCLVLLMPFLCHIQQHYVWYLQERPDTRTDWFSGLERSWEISRDLECRPQPTYTHNHVCPCICVCVWFTQKGVRSIPNLIQSSRKFWLTCEVLGHRSAKRPAALRDLRPSNHLLCLSCGSQPPATCVREAYEVLLPSSITVTLRRTTELWHRKKKGNINHR